MLRDEPLTIENAEGSRAGTRIFRLRGPFTLQNLFAVQAEWQTVDLPIVSIVDLAGVPYMDSAGMGSIINYYVHCQNRGARVIVAGVNGRVMELFKLTKVSTVIPMVATVEEAEGLA